MSTIRTTFTIGLAVVFLVCARAELQSVQVPGATYNSVAETLPHVGAIVGTLRDAKGRPTAGAIVKIQEEPKLVSESHTPGSRYEGKFFEVAAGRHMLRFETKTSDAGAFAFKNIPISPFSLNAYTENGRIDTTLSLTANTQHVECNLTLDPAVTIRGRVVDSQGKPVPNASVDANAEFQRDNPEEHWSALIKTGADGSFEIPGAPIVTYCFLACIDSLVGKYQRNVIVTDGPIELTAVRTGKVSGIVVDEASGTPLSKIPVRLRSTTEGVNDGLMPIESDVDGKFTYERVFPGKTSINIEFFPEPQNLVVANGPIIVEVPEGGEVSTTVKVKKGAEVSGVVLNADTGEPIRAAQILFDGATSNGYPGATTNEKGEYHASGFSGGDLKIEYLSADGYPQGDATTSTEVTLQYGKTVTASPIKVARCLSLSGKVVDEAGKPVPALSVVCLIALDRFNTKSQCAYSGADGAFKIYGLAKGDSVRVYAAPRTFDKDLPYMIADPVGPLTVDENGLAAMTLKAYPAGTISGTLLDKDNNPVPDILVKAQRADVDDYPLGTFDCRSDRNGHFAITQLARGDYNILGYVSGTPGPLDARKFTVSPGQQLEITVSAIDPAAIR